MKLFTLMHVFPSGGMEQTCPYSSGNGEKRNLLNKNGDGGLLTDGPTALQKKKNCGDDDGDGDADPPTVVCQILKGL
ncbi:hypothetical protein F2P81_015728 [Scophthalmus maximus]|uniref:Uncharacterized protein n=1 Tax=Scophthalmus maximus TaxID=52904 RepID=A0A6A4SAA8_SCOMX|nr:hypothetical protein F2P81_015728 [Scophthalmus maximus]